MLPPQLQRQSHLQPIPVPSDAVFQEVFTSQAMQRLAQREDTMASGVLGSLQRTDPMMMATAFGRGITVPLVSSQGQSPMDMSAAGPAHQGGLQPAQMMTPRDRPILNLPREPAIALQVPESCITYDPSTQQYTYHGADAAELFTIAQRMCSTDWARSSCDTQ